MTVGEESQGKEAGMDKFPVGMRVLAVDDDPVCLKLLESLLRHCKYHVTTAAHAETALKILREGKDQFDLVISDVHMPDMDGFKLLELIGLEMDIPVIMLSANGETETVMKGITHGACDYLVKPVRVKELKNIWQHVVRRKPDLRNRSSGGSDDADQKVQSGNAEPEGEQGGAKRTRKYSRKKRNDVDDSADNKENTDLSSEKRPRVTWTSQLHRKFVEVVNQIGIERAVPKKILDMMGVDYITRENVASHLQKYRLYLKRVSKCTSRKSNLFVDASERWNSVFNKNELDNIKDYREHERRQPSPADASSNSSNLFGRMNSPSALGARGLLTTQSIQLSNAQSNLGIGRVGHGGSLLKDAVPKSLQGLLNGGPSNARNCFSSGNSFANSWNGGPSDARKCFPSGPSGNSFANISNGTMLDASKCFPSYHSGNSYASILRGNLLDSSKGILSCLSGNSFADISNGGILAPANQFPVQSPEFGNHPSVQMNSSSTDLFGPLVRDASQFPDPGNCSNSWQTVVPSKFSDLRKDGTSLGPSQANTPKINQLSSFAASSDQIPMFGNELQNQMAAIMNTNTSMAGLSEQMAPFNIGSNTSSKEMLNDNFAFGSASSISSALHNLQMGRFVMPAQMLNGGDAGGILPVQDGTADQQAVDDQLDYSNDFLMGTNGPNGSGDLDDIVAGLLNQDFIENEDAFTDGDWELVP